ncbi:thiamine pyrophosphate-dependent enzyme [Desulfonatronum sp. SC1]|uniref:thiamine pyrophosphate-dependent enzyme n=1 Tax=Desulfonatronum sp. SC1 TaxID=2109626 RepID=UPI000D30CA67|nr:thiamine pyrophosphate-dependent enzyme [Desulfonatronum sp. SC1]PTN36534.1 2-oxoglutarate oxidoreductase [Desulfonatronum sp. SC1]
MKNGKAAFTLPGVLADVPTHYCPGCQHGVAQRLVAECLDELALSEKAICIGSIGCSVFIYNYLMVDCVEAPHGRAPAVATGVKRARPEAAVFTYQGDGDLASIGMAETMHCANRGERVTIVFVNNTVYGMTGGQMAPTTMVGQRTTTCPGGRCADSEGEPIRMTEIIASLGGTAYAARVAVDSVKNVRAAKKAVRRAFEAPLNNLGLGFVEILATCPTNWKMTPVQANKRIAEELIPYFPLGTYKDLAAREAVDEREVGR